MTMDVFCDNAFLFSVAPSTADAVLENLVRRVSSSTGVPASDLYATQNGRKFSGTVNQNVPVRFVSRLCGGKGGFGSMLRAIGAQIEKTTNREACRDLSGRRLRDIREEQRLRGWAASKAQREEEAKHRKQQRLNRLCAVPSHEFKDEAYEEARRGLEEKAEEALQAGCAAPTPTPSNHTGKRRRPNLWIDEDMSDLSSEESGCEADEVAKPVTSCVSGKGKGLGKRSRPAEPAQESAPPATASSTDSGNESDIKSAP